jgi:membrane-associated protein
MPGASGIVATHRQQRAELRHPGTVLISFSQLDVSSPVSYLVAFILPALDALIPVVPSETAIITLGVATAGSLDPRIGILLALAAAGAWLGDNVNYLLGRWFGPAVVRRFLSGEKGRKQRAWAERSLDRYGARLIVACRFIPGGRTAITLTCGLIGYRHRTFMAATAVAAVIWACYAFFIGRLGGQAFEDKPWAGLLLALGAVLLVSGVVEVVRRIRGRNRPEPGPPAAEDPAPTRPPDPSPRG